MSKRSATIMTHGVLCNYLRSCKLYHASSNPNYISSIQAPGLLEIQTSCLVLYTLYDNSFPISIPYLLFDPFPFGTRNNQYNAHAASALNAI